MQLLNLSGVTRFIIMLLACVGLMACDGSSNVLSSRSSSQAAPSSVSPSSSSSEVTQSSVLVACSGSVEDPLFAEEFAEFYGLCSDVWGVSLEEFCTYAPLASECISSSSSSGTQCPTGQTMDQYGTCGYFENDCLSRGKHSAQCLAQCQSDPGSDSACKAVLAGKHSRCTVDYNAMGNGSWQACYTLEDGTAECLHKDSGTEVTQVKWDDGTAVTNAAQITGAGYYEVILVTTEGAVHYGSRSGLSKNTPLFAAGGINATGGQNTLCAIVLDDGRKDVRCWGKDKDPSRPELPLDFNAKQLSANYSDVCTLNDKGEAWCWQQKSDNSLDFIQSSPAKAPFSEAITHISVGQLVVCGVKASGGLECLARWSDAGYLPTKGGDTQVPVAQAGMEDVVAFQAGFGQGISIHANGKAKLWKGGQAMEFDGINNAIAGGGDRALACVLTSESDVYCLDNNMKPVKVNGDKAATAGVCPL